MRALKFSYSTETPGGPGSTKRKRKNADQSEVSGKPSSPEPSIEQLLQQSSAARILQELPRYNWLEQKILQRNSYTTLSSGSTSTASATVSTAQSKTSSTLISKSISSPTKESVTSSVTSTISEVNNKKCSQTLPKGSESGRPLTDSSECFDGSKNFVGLISSSSCETVVSSKTTSLVGQISVHGESDNIVRFSTSGSNWSSDFNGSGEVRTAEDNEGERTGAGNASVYSYRDWPASKSDKASVDTTITCAYTGPVSSIPPPPQPHHNCLFRQGQLVGVNGQGEPQFEASLGAQHAYLGKEGDLVGFVSRKGEEAWFAAPLLSEQQRRLAAKRRFQLQQHHRLKSNTVSQTVSHAAGRDGIMTSLTESGTSTQPLSETTLHSQEDDGCRDTREPTGREILTEASNSDTSNGYVLSLPSPDFDCPEESDLTIDLDADSGDATVPNDDTAVEVGGAKLESEDPKSINCGSESNESLSTENFIPAPASCSENIDGGETNEAGPLTAQEEEELGNGSEKGNQVYSPASPPKLIISQEDVEEELREECVGQDPYQPSLSSNTLSCVEEKEKADAGNVSVKSPKDAEIVQKGDLAEDAPVAATAEKSSALDLKNMDLTVVDQHKVGKGASQGKHDGSGTIACCSNQSVTNNTKEAKEMPVAAGKNSQSSQDFSRHISIATTENDSLPAPAAESGGEAAPLDLCVKKSDALSQAHTQCRPKGNPPVQMVLPQVQSQRATSAATTGIAHRTSVSTYSVSAEQTKTGRPEYRVSNRSHGLTGELNLSGFDIASTTAPGVSALAATSDVPGSHHQDVGSVEPMEAVIMGHHQRPRRFHSQDMSALSLEPEGKRARLLRPGEGQVYPPEDIVAVAVERSNILSSSTSLRAEAASSTALSGAYAYADSEMAVDNLSNIRGVGEGSRQTAHDSDIHTNKNSSSAHYINPAACRENITTAKSKTGLRSDEIVGVSSLYYTNTSPSKTLSDTDLDREFQKHLMEFQALEKLAERKAREQMQVALMRKRKAEMLRAMEAKKARRDRQLKAAEQGSDLHLQSSVDGGQFSAELRVSREQAGGIAFPSSSHNTVEHGANKNSGRGESVAPNNEHPMSYTRANINEKQLRLNYRNSTYQRSISSGVPMSVSPASLVTDHSKSIGLRQRRAFSAKSHPQVCFMGLPRGARAPQTTATSSHHQMQFSGATNTLVPGRDVEAPLNLSAAARKPGELKTAPKSETAARLTFDEAYSRRMTSSASASTPIVSPQLALHRTITPVSTSTTVTTGAITAVSPSPQSTLSASTALATLSQFVTNTLSTVVTSSAKPAEMEPSTALPLNTSVASSVSSNSVTTASAETKAKDWPMVSSSHTTATTTPNQSVLYSSTISSVATVASTTSISIVKPSPSSNAFEPPTSLHDSLATVGSSLVGNTVSEDESLPSNSIDSHLDKSCETKSSGSSASIAVESFALGCSAENTESAVAEHPTLSETDEAVANLLTQEQISEKETSQTASSLVQEPKMDPTLVLMSRVKKEVGDEEVNFNESDVVAKADDSGQFLTVCKVEQVDIADGENQNSTRDGLRIKSTCTVDGEGQITASGELVESLPFLIEPKSEVITDDGTFEVEDVGIHALAKAQNVSSSDETSLGSVAIGMSQSDGVIPFSGDTSLVKIKQESETEMPHEKGLLVPKCDITTVSGGLDGLSPALNVLSESYVEYKTVFSELPPATGDRRTSRRVKSDTITIRSSLWSDVQTPVSVPPTANSAPPTALTSGLSPTSQGLASYRTGSLDFPTAAHQVRPEPLPLHVEPLEILGDRETYRVRSAYHRRDVAVLEPPFMKDAVSTNADTSEDVPRPAHNQPPFQTAGNLIVRSSVADDGIGVDVSMVNTSPEILNSGASMRPSSLDSSSKQLPNEVTNLRPSVTPNKSIGGINTTNRSASLDSSDAISVSRKISHTGNVQTQLPSLTGDREGQTSDVTELNASVQPFVPSGSSLHQQLQMMKRAQVDTSHRQLSCHQSPSQFQTRLINSSDGLQSNSTEGQTPINLESKRSAFKSLKKKQQALDLTPVVDLTHDNGRALGHTSDGISYGTEAELASGYPLHGVLVQLPGSAPYLAEGELLQASNGSLSYQGSTSIESMPVSSDAARKLPGNFERNRSRPGGFLTMRNRMQSRDTTIRSAEVPLVSREVEGMGLRKPLASTASSSLPRLAPKLLQQSTVSPKSTRDPHIVPTGAEAVSMVAAPEMSPAEETHPGAGRRNFPAGMTPRELSMMSRHVVPGNKKIPARPTPVLPSNALLQRPMIPVAISDELLDSRAAEKYTRETTSEMERGVVPAHIHPAFLPPQQHAASDYIAQGMIADAAPMTHNPPFMNGLPGKKSGPLMGEDFNMKRNSGVSQYHHLHHPRENIVPAHLFQQQQQQQQKQQLSLHQQQQQLHHQQQQMQQMQHQQRLKQRQAEHQQNMASSLKAQYHPPSMSSGHIPYQKIQQQQQQQQQQQELRHHYPPEHHLSPFASQNHRQHQHPHLQQQSQPRPQMQQPLQQHASSHYQHYQGAHVQDITRVRSPQQHKNGPLGGAPTHPQTANPRMSSAYAQNVSHPMVPPSLVPNDFGRSVGYPDLSPNRGPSMTGPRLMTHGIVGPTSMAYNATHATGALDMTRQEQRHLKKPSMHQRRTSPQQPSLAPPQQSSQQPQHLPHHHLQHPQHLHQMQQQPQQAHHVPPPPPRHHHHQQHPHHHLSTAAAAAAHPPPPQPHAQTSATAPSLQRHHVTYPASVPHGGGAYSAGISGYGNGEADVGTSYGAAGNVSSGSAVVGRPPGRSQGSNSMCEVCGKVAVFLCSSCRKVWYCNQQCQTKHWATHAPVCKASRSNQ